MKNYDSFAPFYDFAMGDQKQVALALLRIIRQYAPKARTLLEFGCGSGSLLKLFVRHYRCAGIDLSAGMVEIARRKVPQASIQVGDISKVRLNKKFDVIVCAFDTINHIPDFSRWELVFKRAHEQLEEGGVFIFDINTQTKINRYHREPPYVEVDKSGVSVFDVTRTSRSRYNLSVKVFKKKSRDLFQLHEMIVHGATFPVSRIKTSLSRHFSKIRLIDLERAKPSVNSEELYFVCSKPHRL